MQSVYPEVKDIFDNATNITDFTHQIDNLFHTHLTEASLTLYEQLVITSAFHIGKSPEYLLAVVRNFHARQRFTDKKLKIWVDQAISAAAQIVAHGTEEQRIENLTALVKAYPKELCNATFFVGRAPRMVAYAIMDPAQENEPLYMATCLEMVLAANITLDDGINVQDLHDIAMTLSAIYRHRGLPRRLHREHADLDIAAICEAQTAIQEYKIARNQYVRDYMCYFTVCHRILSRWKSAEMQSHLIDTLPTDLVRKILSFIEPIDRPSIANTCNVVYELPRLLPGGDLHNLMITTLLSKHHKGLHPSCEDAERISSVRVVVEKTLMALQGSPNICKAQSA